MIRRGFTTLALVASAGCNNSFVQVRVEEPSGARVVFEEGYRVDAVSTTSPFTARLEGVSLADADAYNLKFDLDARAAAQYGGRGAVTLYGKLCVGPPTPLALAQTIVLRMPPEKIRALVQGERSEIETFVEDPNGSSPTEIVRLTLRTRPF